MKNIAKFFQAYFLLPACKISEEPARNNFWPRGPPSKKAKAKRNDSGFLFKKNMLFLVVPAVFGATQPFSGFEGLLGVWALIC